jgi:hypothetical protein
MDCFSWTWRAGARAALAEDEAVARRFMEENPIIKAGTFKDEVHPVAMSNPRKRDR